ncbi:MAG: hypothetical protein IJN82_07400, partial [Clostridia bacterium]|nr:hypothetical protein [Clostridia bacterium]
PTDLGGTHQLNYCPHTKRIGVSHQMNWCPTPNELVAYIKWIGIHHNLFAVGEYQMICCATTNNLVEQKKDAKPCGFASFIILRNRRRGSRGRDAP